MVNEKVCNSLYNLPGMRIKRRGKVNMFVEYICFGKPLTSVADGYTLVNR